MQSGDGNHTKCMLWVTNSAVVLVRGRSFADERCWGAIGSGCWGSKGPRCWGRVRRWCFGGVYTRSWSAVPIVARGRCSCRCQCRYIWSRSTGIGRWGTGIRSRCSSVWGRCSIVRCHCLITLEKSKKANTSHPEKSTRLTQTSLAAELPQPSLSAFPDDCFQPGVALPAG